MADPDGAPNPPYIAKLPAAALLIVCGAASISGSAQAQSSASAALPTSPPAQQIHVDGVSLRVPAGWAWTRADGEVSNFHDDARTSPANAHLIGSASIAYNPFPLSSFSGATIYLTFAAKQTASHCTRQAEVPAPLEASATARFPEPAAPAAAPSLPGVTFNHGHDAHGVMCTEERDEVYTTMHRGACYRADLVLHTFCGGAASGAQDMTAEQIDSIRARLNGIFATFKFDR
jgi:hypothetical protein